MTKKLLHTPFSTIVASSLLFLSIGFGKEHSNHSSHQHTDEVVSPAHAQKDSIVVSVKGMVCDFCAQGLKKSFLKKAKVDSIHVSLEKGLVTIYPKLGQQLSNETISERIKDNGISVESIQRITPLENP